LNLQGHVFQSLESVRTRLEFAKQRLMRSEFSGSEVVDEEDAVEVVDLVLGGS
jgi:hypothetical protein